MVNLLKKRAIDLGVLPVYEELIKEFPQFYDWAGSGGPSQHHYEDGGLARHTSEIIEVGLSSIHILGLTSKIDPVEFYLAALFHDTGKMYDYVKVDGKWGSSLHKRLIYHLPRSAIIWHDISKEVPYIYDKYHDAVLHDILAHHGRREHGSPVMPKTHAAWLLHLCDGISARMDDAGTLDLVTKYNATT